MTNAQSGRTVVITGGAGGLGRAVVHRFLEEQMNVFVPCRESGEIEDLRREFDSDRFAAALADLTRDEDAARVLEQARERFGRLDALLHLAGGWAGGHPLEDAEPAEFERLIDQNLRTAWACTRHALRIMKGAGAGVILHVGARAALEPSANMVSYSLSKAGVVALTRGAAQEALPHGVRVNAILPSTIDTPANRAAMPDADHDSWVSPEAIARVLLFLVSEDSAPISGALIPVYGRA